MEQLHVPAHPDVNSIKGWEWRLLHIFQTKDAVSSRDGQATRVPSRVARRLSIAKTVGPNDWECNVCARPGKSDCHAVAGHRHCDSASG